MIVNTATWKKLKETSSNADFGGSEKYPIVDPIHLIAMKLHSAKQPDRQEYLKDLNDVAEIMRCQNYSFEYLKQAGILDKHGTEKTLSELRRLFEPKQ